MKNQSLCGTGGVCMVACVLVGFYIFYGGEFEDRSNIAITNINLSASLLEANSPSDTMDMCTHSLLRQYFEENRHFPGAGKWRTVDNDTFFHPFICHLENRINSDHLLKCLTKKHISSIATFGDSNGDRYFKALQRVFVDFLKADCEYLRMEDIINEGFTPDSEYYRTDLNPKRSEHVIVMKDRQCRTCRSRSMTCNLTSPTGVQRDLRLTHGAVTKMLDPTVRVENSKNETIIGSLQEFTLKYTLKNSYPDMIIIFCPLHHMKFKTFEDFSQDVSQLREFVNDQVPKSTKIFYFPAHGEFEPAKKNVSHRYVRRRGLLPDQIIHSMNKLLFDELQDDLLHDSRVYGFFNLWELGASRQPLWSKDGTHMHQIWYDKIIEIFFELMCNDERL